MLTVNNFSVHGSMKLRLEGRLLVVEGRGPWNMESMQDSSKRVESIFDELFGAPWAVLVMMQGDPIYVPEAAKFLIESVKAEKKQGRIASAVMLNESDLPKFGKRHISDIYRSAGETFEFFDEIQPAKDWLYSQLTLAEASHTEQAYSLRID